MWHTFLTRPLCIGILLLSFSMQANAQTPAISQTILVIGDSLSAEYGLTKGAGWVALLEQAIKKEQGLPPTTIINASISGDTTAGGHSRLPAALKKHNPTILILELGANDALRGIPLDVTKKNLETMIKLGQKAQAKILLLGIQVPPNYGQAYTEQLAQLYVDLAKEHHTALVPFFLKGVANIPDSEQYFQKDKTHPNETAHPVILKNILPEVLLLLKN